MPLPNSLWLVASGSKFSPFCFLWLDVAASRARVRPCQERAAHPHGDASRVALCLYFCRPSAHSARSIPQRPRPCHDAAVRPLVCVPTLELLLGKEHTARSGDAQISSRHGDEPGCNTLATDACVHFVVFGYALRRYCADETESQTRMGVLLSFGIMNSFSLIVAHELCHSSEGTWEFNLGQALHATACRMHDPFEHNGVHHPQVATASDNGTARRGETIYAFIVRSTLLTHADAYRERLQKHGHRAAACAVIGWALWPLAIACTSAWACGSARAFQFFFGQALVAIPLVASGNYVAHYGFSRDNVPKRTPPHLLAWNSYHIVSNALLLNLPIHSIHHLVPKRPFPLHNAFPIPNSPTMPLPYAISSVLASSCLPCGSSSCTGPLTRRWPCCACITVARRNPRANHLCSVGGDGMGGWGGALDSVGRRSRGLRCYQSFKIINHDKIEILHTRHQCATRATHAKSSPRVVQISRICGLHKD